MAASKLNGVDELSPSNSLGINPPPRTQERPPQTEMKTAFENLFEPIPEWMFGTSVEARNALQNCGKVHPYTCGNNECRKKTMGAPLLAVEGGWKCEHCDYTQNL